MIVRSFDEPHVKYEGAASAQEMVDFMLSRSVPTLIEFSEDYIEPIFGQRRAAIILFSEDKDAAYNAIWKEAAHAMKGEILFVTSGISEGIQARLAEFVGAEASNTPSIRLVHPAEELKKFVWEGDLSALSVDAIRVFVNEFNEGKLVAHLKSEPIPEEQGDVIVLVGKSYDGIVNDPSKDVLVKFYAPWCGHCKKLAPVWDELAAKVSHVDDLIIAKFDATANEVEGLNI